MVLFLSDSQSGFIKIRELLDNKKLTARVIKSKSVFSNISNLIRFDKNSYYSSLGNLSKCPVYLIKNKYRYGNILESFKGLKVETFLEKKMFVLGCFYKGKVYNFSTLFGLKGNQKALLPINQTILCLLYNLKFYPLFLLKVICIYNTL